MSKSNDPDHFFQTSSSLAETSRKAHKSSNTHGHPIHLRSKILAVIPDPTNSSAIYVAESAGTARRIVLEPASKHEIFRSSSSTAPLTSLALSPQILFAASWDTTIHSWALDTRAPSRRFVGGHADFVKCLVVIANVLISGGADATIVVWDIASGVKLQVLRTGHSRGVLYLAVDPSQQPEEEEEEAIITIFSASSDRTIRRYTLSPHRLQESHPSSPILVHETSVNALHFEPCGDLWTASADGTAKCLSRARNWAADTVLVHGDYVRAIAVDDVGGWVVTAGRSEDVKVWDKSSGELRHCYEGHFDEVTGLVLVKGGAEVVSVGIDMTVRRWSLRREDLEREREEEVIGENDGGGKDGKGATLTEEEERELEELMEDDG